MITTNINTQSNKILHILILFKPKDNPAAVTYGSAPLQVC